MTTLTETSSLSFLASVPPTNTTTNILIGVLVFAAAAQVVHSSSPTRLTGVLVAALAETERTYLEAIEAGIPSASDGVHITKALTGLQIKVSNIREATLRNSMSHRATFCAFLMGHTVKVLRCIAEVRGLETRIEILKERRLRDCDAQLATGILTPPVSFRRRQSTHPNFMIL